MTNTPQDPQDKSTPKRRRWRRVLVYSGLGLGTITIAGGVALVSWIKTDLAPMVETSLTKLLQRPIKVGQLESVGIGYLKFGRSLVPETATNPDFASTEAVEVRFPLVPLLSRTLKLNVTLVDVEAYIQQREDGSFEAPQIAAGGPSPINIEVESLQTPGLKAVILPMPQLGGKAASPIPLTLENAIIKTKDQQQRISANLDGSFDNGGSFKLAVDSEPAKQYTTLAAEGNALKIPELAQLMANPAIQLPAGEATGKVSMEIIDEEVENANGSVELKGVRANLEGLTKPVLASGRAKLIGNRAIADNLAINYGAIATKIDGEAQFGPNYDLNRASFDLDAELAPAEIDALLNAARDEIDLQLRNAAENKAPETEQQLREVAANLQNLKSMLNGEVTAKVAITGNMPSPTISGKIETTSYTQIDRVGFDRIATNFQFVPQFDPQLQLVAAGISFSDLIIKPTIGGEIKGSGLYELIPESSNLESRVRTAHQHANLESRVRTAHQHQHPTALLVQSPPQTPDIQLPSLQFVQSPIPNPPLPPPLSRGAGGEPIPNPLNIDLEIKDLPVGEFARLYGVTSPLPLGNLSATAKVAGPVEDIDGQILWALSGGIYPAEGIVNVRNSQATIEKAIVQIGSGNLQLDGFANLEDWQVTATANRIPLAALEPLEPLGLPPGLEGIANGQFRLGGPTNNFSPRAIAGNGSATLDIADGTASVTGKLDRGLWQANANLSELELSELERIAANAGLLETGRPQNLRNRVSGRGNLFDRGDGRLNFRGDFTGNVDNFTQINGNSTAAIITPGGAINANANINSGLVRATIDTNKLALNPLIDLGISAVDVNTRNELKEQTDKLKSVGAELTSRVNLSGNLANLAPDSIDANMEANLQIDEGAIATDATLNSGNFRANLDTTSLALGDVEEILKKTGFLPPDTVIFPQEIDGEIEGGARISGNINNLTPAGIDLDGDAQLKIAGGTIDATARANSGQFQTSVNTSEIAVNSLLALIEEIVDSEAVVLDRNQVDSFKQQLPVIGALNSTLELSATARGNLNNLTPAAINGNLDAVAKIDDKTIEARGNLNRGQFDIFLESDKIALSYLEQTVRKTGVAELPQELTLPKQIDGDIDLNGRIRGNLANLSPEAIAANLEANLRVGDNRANAVANLNYGILEAQLNAEPIPLSYIEEIGGELGLIPPSLLPLGIDGVIEAGGSISGTIAALSPPFQRGAGGDLAANLTGQVRLDEGGAIDLLANLQEEGWEASVTSDRLALSQFSELIEKQEAAAPAVRGIQQARTLLGQAENAPILTGFLDGRVNLKGSSLTNFSPEAITATGNLAVSELPVLLQPFETAFNWRGDRLEIEKATTPGLFASGTVDVDFPGETTAISNIDLDVNISDFDVEQAYRLSSVEQASRLLTGVVNFDGKIAGNPDNLTLAGDLSLENLAVNKIAFDPLLAGNFNLGLNEGLDLKLAGERDRIELALDEEFFPSSFLISRDEAVARGITRGEDLEVYLEDFPLQALQIVPLPNIGVVSGITSAELTVFNVKSLDLESISADGNVTINDPAVGYIDGDIFTAGINYADGVGVLSDGKFILGKSEYLLDARTDLNQGNEGGEFNPEFTASLRVKDGKTQDILTALKWFSIEEITQQAANNFEAPVYGSAEDLQTASVGSKGASLLLQLRRFVEIQALLARQEQLREQAYPVVVPPLSELSAIFSATINASGSLKSGVKGDFNVVGDDWQWGLYSVDSFLLEGTYENEVLTVLPLRVETEGGLLSFSGVVGSENVGGQLRVEALSLEELQKFVKDLPREIVDVKGELNAEATFAGSLANPRAIGDINITNGTLNNQPIKEAQSSFSYNNARLNFGGDAVITGEEPILFLGTIPYQLPFASVSPDSEVINISVELKDEALKIVNLFTDQIMVEDATAEIGLLVGGTLAEPEAQGKATITDMTVKAATFPDPLTDIEGSVLFRGDRLLVESLTGSLSDGEVKVTGVLPIVTPLAPGDPDIEKPLAIALEELKIDYEKFFQGDIDGQVIITGAALSPIIGGDIEVSDGRVLLNEAAGFASQFSSEEETPILPTGEQFEIRLQDLEVNLANRLRMESLGLANFQVIGSLILNGTATDPAPSGEIDLQGGTINLFSTDLRLDRDYQNTAIFQPSLGLNPLVDLRLEASVLETNRLKAPTAALSSEIADTPIQGGLGSSRKIEVAATVRGLLTEAQDNLQLTSSPQRTESQIIALLGGSIVDTFRDDSTLALANIASTTLFSSLEQDVLDATGLSEFRIFPARTTQRGSQRASELGVGLEVGLDITDRLGASVTQVFASNAPTEFSLRYGLSDRVTLRGGTNFQDNSVFSVEYEVQF